ncbi:unnamed protein product, partial [Amoebophrya sp. A120]
NNFLFIRHCQPFHTTTTWTHPPKTTPPQTCVTGSVRPDEKRGTNCSTSTWLSTAEKNLGLERQAAATKEDLVPNGDEIGGNAARRKKSAVYNYHIWNRRSASAPFHPRVPLTLPDKYSC